MNIGGLLRFLTGLKNNNNREWFQKNKELYQEVLITTQEITRQLLNGMSGFEPGIINLTPSDCTYRIYRDVRFSIDKSPYKTHIGIFINPPYGKKSLRMGYYLHLEPKNCFLGAGNIGYPTKLLNKIRQEIYDNVEEYREIIENPLFKKTFPVVGDDLLKSAPKGFPKNWEHLDLIRPRTFFANHQLNDFEIRQSDIISQLAEMFRIAKPFNDFVNYSVDEFLGLE